MKIKNVQKNEKSLNVHLVIGFIIRVMLICFGVHHDKTHVLKYTDIDYHVFTDAAREVCNGNSPFDRQTYRYTPFLAFFLIPNIKLHFLFGKFIFCFFDILTAKFIFVLLKKEGYNNKECQIGSYLWLYNPLVIGISSRGSSESIMTLLTLLFLYFIKLRLPILSGVVLGAAVHFKLYPIIYSLPGYLSFSHSNENLWKKLWPNLAKLKFVLGFIFSFSLLTSFAYILCGEKYIEETFIYHLTRIDTRHNFSIYFYLLYLTMDHNLPYLSLVTLVPQAFATIILGTKYSSTENIHFALFSQTFAFVTFNKVITSQYFIWFLVYLPLIRPSLNMSGMKSLSLLSIWFFAQASWLLPAYLFEFEGYNTFFVIWIESIAFFCCNVGILISCIRSYRQRNLAEIKKNR